MIGTLLLTLSLSLHVSHSPLFYAHQHSILVSLHQMGNLRAEVKAELNTFKADIFIDRVCNLKYVNCRLLERQILLSTFNMFMCVYIWNGWFSAYRSYFILLNIKVHCWRKGNISFFFPPTEMKDETKIRFHGDQEFYIVLCIGNGERERERQRDGEMTLKVYVCCFRRILSPTFPLLPFCPTPSQMSVQCFRISRHSTNECIMSKWKHWISCF